MPPSVRFVAVPEQICFIEIDYPKRAAPNQSLEETKKIYIERVIVLLDQYCRQGWRLALEHEERINMFRRAHYLMLDKPPVVQMTPEDGVMFRMFAGDDVMVRNSCIRDKMHALARFSAGSALRYRGRLYGFPVELLHENARNWLNREVSTALLNSKNPNYASIPDLPSGYAGSWPCWS